MNDLQKDFVKTIKHRLVDLEWTAKELCHVAGISSSLWSEITKGKKSPTVECMVKVCRAVGLDVHFRIKAKVSQSDDLQPAA